MGCRPTLGSLRSVQITQSRVMKSNLFVTLMVAFCLLTFNYTLTSYGDDQGDQGDGQDQQDQESQDQEGPDNGEIDGSESLEAKVILVATTNAPAGATGCAKIV